MRPLNHRHHRLPLRPPPRPHSTTHNSILLTGKTEINGPHRRMWMALPYHCIKRPCECCANSKMFLTFVTIRHESHEPNFCCACCARRSRHTTQWRWTQCIAARTEYFIEHLCPRYFGVYLEDVADDGIQSRLAWPSASWASIPTWTRCSRLA